jgi:hypothetical protein
VPRTLEELAYELSQRALAFRAGCGLLVSTLGVWSIGLAVN